MTKRTHNDPAPPTSTRSFPRVGAIVSAVVLLVAGVIWWNNRSRTQAPGPTSFSELPTSTNQPSASSAPNPSWQKLRGKWLRPDGGYIVEVRDIENDGTLKVAYFNPRPIHVSKATVTQETGGLKVFIELQDVNYPGCTYNLVYEAGKDQLVGIYYQAALQQRFEVFFDRVQ